MSIKSFILLQHIIVPYIFLHIYELKHILYFISKENKWLNDNAHDTQPYFTEVF